MLINVYKSHPSPDTYELSEPIKPLCPMRKGAIESNIIYINPNNNQVYVRCPFCSRHESSHFNKWHRITYVKHLEWISRELGIELIKYKKQQTEDVIFKTVKNQPGANLYQITKTTKLSKDKVRRGVARLKTKGKVRVRCVGNEKRVYPIL